MRVNFLASVTGEVEIEIEIDISELSIIDLVIGKMLEETPARNRWTQEKSQEEELARNVPTWM